MWMFVQVVDYVKKPVLLEKAAILFFQENSFRKSAGDHYVQGWNKEDEKIRKCNKQNKNKN